MSAPWTARQPEGCDRRVPELVGLGAVCANNRKDVIGPTIKSLITERLFWYLFIILPATVAALQRVPRHTSNG
jgi:hypothetical protein